MNIQNYLDEAGTDVRLNSIITDLSKCAIDVMHSLGGDQVAKKLSTSNSTGDTQMAIDVISNTIFIDAMRGNNSVAMVGSEELDEVTDFRPEGYCVMFDPLDGSSLLDVNLSIGSIVGIYPDKDIFGKTGDRQVASMIFVYGPRLTLVLTVRQGTHEFTYMNGEFILTKKSLQLDNDAKMYAPGNLRAISTNEKYRKLIEYWMNHQYTLRYSGGMVPDVNQILLKGCGIFTYPAYDKAPEGKLRLLFECAPIALLVEQAGGKANDGQMRILDKVITELHQKTPIIVGKSSEVECAMEILR